MIKVKRFESIRQCKLLNRMKKKRNLVVALSGPIGAGKSYLAKTLEEHLNFKIIRTRDVIAEYIVASGQVVNDKTLQEFGKHLMNPEESENFCQILLKHARSADRVVIDSIRPKSHLDFLVKQLDNLCFLYVIAPEEVRRARFMQRRGGRDNSSSDFDIRNSHNVESEVRNLITESDLILNNKSDDDRIKRQLLNKVYPLLFDHEIVFFQELVDKVIDFHKIHNYEIDTGNWSNLSACVGLMIEELGEIHECISKGTGNIMEEHADLLYLSLGNSITLGMDFEKEFIAKHRHNMKRPPKLKSGAELRNKTKE